MEPCGGLSSGAVDAEAAKAPSRARVGRMVIFALKAILFSSTDERPRSVPGYGRRQPSPHIAVLELERIFVPLRHAVVQRWRAVGAHPQGEGKRLTYRDSIEDAMR